MSAVRKFQIETKALFQCCWISKSEDTIEDSLEEDWQCIIQVKLVNKINFIIVLMNGSSFK